MSVNKVNTILSTLVTNLWLKLKVRVLILKVPESSLEETVIISVTNCLCKVTGNVGKLVKTNYVLVTEFVWPNPTLNIS